MIYANIHLKPIIRLIPSIKGHFDKTGKMVNFSLTFSWLFFVLDIGR